LIENKEIELLDAISQDPRVTQSGLSAQLGIAVGSVNWYIKRLITRGYIKVSRLDRTRLQYDLTPEGMSVLTQRALQYMRGSLKVYKELRDEAKNVVAQLAERGITHVYLDGEDEKIDILRLTCIEAGLFLEEKPGKVLLKINGKSFEIQYGDEN
jgi:DNA-binding MarR family transcriptional regulator